MKQKIDAFNKPALTWFTCLAECPDGSECGEPAIEIDLSTGTFLCEKHCQAINSCDDFKESITLGSYEDKD